MLFIFLSPVLVQAQGPDYYSCQKDDDCVITKDECGHNTAINNEFLAEWENMISQSGDELEMCPARADMLMGGQYFYAKCQDSECKVLIGEEAEKDFSLPGYVIIIIGICLLGIIIILVIVIYKIIKK